jgi:hypothetical protein
MSDRNERTKLDESDLAAALYDALEACTPGGADIHPSRSNLTLIDGFFNLNAVAAELNRFLRRKGR